MSGGDQANRTQDRGAEPQDLVFGDEPSSGIRHSPLLESDHQHGARFDADELWCEARYVQFGLDGQPLCTSEGFRGWLTDRRMAALGGVVRMANGAQRVQSRVDDVDIQLVRMNHVGVSYYLAVLTRFEPPRRARLSEMQRRVALLAAQGDTAQQISAQLGVSANTVKFHLKRVYELLNVSNRVELSRALNAQP